MSYDFSSHLVNFEALSLAELNATASFLKRIDTKFLLTKDQFMEVLHELKEDFRVLEISGNRVFSYDNIYMDTQDHLFYNQHQNGEKSRTKIRTRLYLDSNLAFFEYKQKQDGITRKFRYQFPTEEHGNMTKGKTRFFEGVWQSMYEGIKAPNIFPSIRTNYKRITLVSKTGEERLTVDFQIQTKNLRDEKAKEIDLKNLVIVEVKTLSTSCKSLDVMARLGFKKSNSCSKYSLGVVYAGIAEKFDTFLETMERIKEIRLETLKNRFRRTQLNRLETAQTGVLEHDGLVIEESVSVA